MKKLFNTEDFWFEGTTSIQFRSVELGIMIHDFETLGIRTLEECIQVNFGDDIRLNMPADKIVKLIVKIAEEACIYSAIDIIEKIAMEVGLFGDREYLTEVHKHLDELREVHYVLTEEARIICQQYPDDDHISFWDIAVQYREANRKREHDHEKQSKWANEAFVSIKDWHDAWLDKQAKAA